MNNTLVLCNHGGRKAAPQSTTFDVTLNINPTPPDQNLKLHVDNISHRILRDVNPLAHDLLEIAAYTYYADCSIKRGEAANVYADRWQRRFELVVPVSDPIRWNNLKIKNLLKEDVH